MELWIRSQDKETLIKVNKVYVNKILNSIRCDYDGLSVLLGVYNSVERALEVLDEIQSLMKPKFLAKEIDKTLTGKKIDIEVFPYGTIIYEMPLN